jgi:hypothetical protein
MAKEESVNKSPLGELFESISSEILDDSVKLQMETIFESALNEAIAAKEAELEAQNEAEVEQFKSEIVENIDDYLSYFTTEYVKENEAVIEDFNKVKIAEKVLRNFKQMCEAFNISLSEESISNEDVVEGLEADNNKLVNQLIEAKKEVENAYRAAFIAEAVEKLETDIQREKLVEKAKFIDFDKDTFAEKLEILAGTILAKESAEADETDDQLEDTEELTESTKTTEKTRTDSMASYLKYIK